MKTLIKKFIPQFVLSWYHKFLAVAANVYYGRPSNKLIVVGVTGTSGKSTTIAILDDLLANAGFKVGYASTIKFKIADLHQLNKKKMTMLGRFQLQKLLAQMVEVGCQYAIIETTSQGIEQWRHWGINYDVVLCTNLYPEHIEAHGSFDNYKAAKLKLFHRLERLPHKKIGGQIIPKVIIVNLDDQYSLEFLGNKADQKFGFTLKSKYDISGVQEVRAQVKEGGLTMEGIDFKLVLLGEFNLYNALAAVTVSLSLGLSFEQMAMALKDFSGVAGRLEEIKEGQPFKIIVDYAFEPTALDNIYQVIKKMAAKKIIHILGSAGGGRDTWRRSVLGEIAGQNADLVIITNEDPYDEDPWQIIEQVAVGAIKAGKVLEQNLFKIIDRRAAINKALSLAQAGDLVLITGKGSEQAIAVAGGKLIPWDDRQVTREELAKLKS